MPNNIWLYGSFVYFYWSDALPAPTLNNADPPFALVIAVGFYLLHVEMADQDPASDSL